MDPMLERRVIEILVNQAPTIAPYGEPISAVAREMKWLEVFAQSVVNDLRQRKLIVKREEIVMRTEPGEPARTETFWWERGMGED